MKGYFGLLHGHSIGDSLAMLSHDVHLEERGIEDYYWVAFLGGPASELMEKGWFNWPLFSLYVRAGLFKRLIVFDGLCYDQWALKWTNYKPHIIASIERNFGRFYSDIEHRMPYVTQWKAVACASTLRERFKFLYRPGETYATVHFASSHYLYADLNSSFIPHTKRASFQTICREMEPCRQFKRVKMVGSLKDRSTVSVAIQKLAKVFPEVTFENCTGTDVEEFFRLLYNSKHHIACETGSPFFTAQLGIPSVKIFLAPQTHVYFGTDPSYTARTNYEPYFSDITALKFVTDDVQVCGTDNADLI